MDGLPVSDAHATDVPIETEKVVVQADLMNDIKRTNRQVDHISVPVLRWTLLDLPGVSLKNSLNKCWFHAGLHLLSAIPNLRSLCLLPPQGISMFKRRFLNAVRAIFHSAIC